LPHCFLGLRSPLRQSKWCIQKGFIVNIILHLFYYFWRYISLSLHSHNATISLEKLTFSELYKVQEIGLLGGVWSKGISRLLIFELVVKNCLIQYIKLRRSKLRWIEERRQASNTLKLGSSEMEKGLQSYEQLLSSCIYH